MRQALGHLDPVLIDGIAAFVVFAPMAAQFAGTRHMQAGQHPTTPLTWALAILLVAPIMTHRRFPLASLAVCLTVLLAYAAGRYVAYPGLPVLTPRWTWKSSARPVTEPRRSSGRLELPLTSVTGG